MVCLIGLVLAPPSAMSSLGPFSLEEAMATTASSSSSYPLLLLSLLVVVVKVMVEV